MSSRKPFDVNNEAELVEGFSSVDITSIEHVFPTGTELQQQLETARNRVKSMSSDSKLHLTTDECIAIHMFTMKTEENSMLQYFFRALDSKNRKEISRWFRFLRILRNGLDKLEQKKINIRQLIHDENELNRIQNVQQNLYSKFGWYQISSKKIISLEEHEISLELVGTDVSRIINSKNTLLIFWPTLVKSVNLEDRITYEHDYSVAASLHRPDHPSIKEQFTQTELTSLANRKSKSTIVFLSDSESSEPITYASASESNHEKLFLSDTPMNNNLLRRRQSQSSINKKHFVCPRRQCKNECNQQHKAGHCRGFKYVPHICKHHCSPTFRCFVCLKHPSDQPLHQCLQCHWLLCETCAFIEI